MSSSINANTGSQEEVDDLKSAYLECKGEIGAIMTHIPHSTHEDEARFIITISDLIQKGELKSLRAWEKSSKDEKAKLVRKKQGKKEAVEAEKLAKELGVWDEFYGSGKVGNRKGKGKGNTEQQDEEEGDVSALQALILKKREKSMDGFFDSLAAKYGNSETSSKSKRSGKKRGNLEVEDEDEPRRKRSRKNDVPDIDDAEFEKLQQKLFGDKKPSHEPPPTKSAKTRGRKVK
jgi:DnaJ homolog subfamily C member 9